MLPTARTLSVRVGDSVRLECLVDADDEARQLLYNWYWRPPGAAGASRSLAQIIDARIANPAARILSIADVEPSDAGEFTCVASSGTGQAEPIVYTLSVVGTLIHSARTSRSRLNAHVTGPSPCSQTLTRRRGHQRSRSRRRQSPPLLLLPVRRMFLLRF